MNTSPIRSESAPPPARGDTARASAEIQTQHQPPKGATHESRWTSEWWLVYVTVALVLVTAVLAVFTARLWKITVRMAREAKESGKATTDRMDASIAESARAAAAMESSVTHAKLSSARQLRSYLGVRPDVEIRRGYSQIALLFRVDIANNGQTPAYRLTTSHAVCIRDPNDAQQPWIEPPMDLGSGVLAPTSITEMRADSSFLVDNAEIPLLKAGDTRRVYYYGTLEYSDAFEVRWRQRFCFWLRWDWIDGPRMLMNHNERNDEVSLIDPISGNSIADI